VLHYAAFDYTDHRVMRRVSVLEPEHASIDNQTSLR
jgi:hypothetical protein